MQDRAALNLVADGLPSTQEGAETFIPTMHSAFDDPQCADNATPRESVECRICTCPPNNASSSHSCSSSKHDCALTRRYARAMNSLLPTSQGGLWPGWQSENWVGCGENALAS